jgi:hypothetical protein
MGSERTAGPYGILKVDCNIALQLVRVVNQIMTTARKQKQICCHDSNGIANTG